MTVYRDENGYVWMVHLLDVTNLPAMFRGTVGEWLDTDRPPHCRNGAADDAWYPIRGDDAEQIAARRDLLRDGTMGDPVRVKGRRGLP